MTSHNKRDNMDNRGLHKSGIIGFTDEDIIYTYTRADAIADGVIIDLSKEFPVCKRVYKFPVCCTQSVWSIINSTPSEWVVGEVIAVIVASNQNKTKIIDETSHLFEVRIENSAPSDRHTMKIICHGDDNGNPCLTIMLPNED